jgi:hypothetical protein
MAFQFQCPQCANLLEAEESQGGQQCNCPLCNTLFIIPTLNPPASESTASARAPEAPTSESPDPQAPFPGIDTTGSARSAPAPKSIRPPAFEPKEPELLHIPCPGCHEVLETPVEMLDQDVMCPHCQAQFQLRRRNSIEYKRRQREKQELRERKLGKAWFNWAIVVAVLVVMFLLLLIFSTPGD